MARALGATLGQGWLFGRPGPGAAPGLDPGELRAAGRRRAVADRRRSPFACLPGRDAAAALPQGAADRAEQAARARGDAAGRDLRGRRDLPGGPALHAGHHAALPRPGRAHRLRLRARRGPAGRAAARPARRRRWRRTTRCAASGTSSSSARTSARRCSPATSATTAPTWSARFEYALTYDRDDRRPRRARAARPGWHPAPRRAGRCRPSRSPPRRAVPGPATAPAAAGDGLLHRRAGGHDQRRHDRRHAAARPAAGLRQRRLRAAGRAAARGGPGPQLPLPAGPRHRPGAPSPASGRPSTAGEECRETLLNYRGPERTPWWNEIHLAPGRRRRRAASSQYIGVQHDVTARVEAERALLEERDRSRSYLARIEELAYTDPLTGLPNRRRLEEQVETALWDGARRRRRRRPAVPRPRRLQGGQRPRSATPPATSCCQRVAERLRSRLRRNDLLARLGGDEFLVALPGLDPATRGPGRPAGWPTSCAAAVSAGGGPGSEVSVGASIGVASTPPTARTSTRCCTSRPRHVRAQGRGRRLSADQLVRQAVEQLHGERRAADAGQPGVAPDVGLGGLGAGGAVRRRHLELGARRHRSVTRPVQTTAGQRVEAGSQRRGRRPGGPPSD